MNQLSLFKPALWSVTEITQYLSGLIQSDHNLQDFWVQGEVSNLSHPKSGHLYFTIKDKSSALKCVMWRSQVNRLPFLPQNGLAIEAHGSLGIYETAGQYQLYIDLLRLAGEGASYQKFLQLKSRLEAKGLFAQENKRQIPRWPKCIGIITSPTGAALQDILNTIRRRYPIVEIVIAPSMVQGEQAPDNIVRALGALNEKIKPDVILIARGGGSIEDLWAFNEEKVARAILKSQAPVITGVGHETDFTIADFVSDLRAPTPTAAAELATPNRVELRISLDEQKQNLWRSLQTIIDSKSWSLRQFENQLLAHSPKTRLRSNRQRLDEFSHRLSIAFDYTMRVQRSNLEGLSKNLESLSPKAVMKRGFAAVTEENGSLVRSIHQALPGKKLNVNLSDGRFGVEVLDSGSES